MRQRYVVRAFIKAHHYLRSAPPSDRLRLGVFAGGQLVGALLFGKPLARCEDQHSTLENTRTVLLPCCPKNSASYALGRALRIIAATFPEVRRVIAYADSTRHGGTIYRAANFEHIGMSQNRSGWGNRRGRRQGPATPKHKYEYLLRGER